MTERIVISKKEAMEDVVIQQPAQAAPHSPSIDDEIKNEPSK